MLVNTMTGMCEQCGADGTSNLMLTAVPFFKEVILSSFSCEHCGYKSTEISFGGKLADFGVRMNCKIYTPAHLNRLVVKSEYASIKIPELNVDIPPRTQKGSMNSVEGILSKMIEGLEEGQVDRKESDPETYKKIAEFTALAKQYATGAKLPLTILIDDPSGNSYIQNPYAPNTDPYNTIEYYVRTNEQLIDMGYMAEGAEEEKKPPIAATKAEQEEVTNKLGIAKKGETKKIEAGSQPKKDLKKHIYTGEEINQLMEKLKKLQLKQHGLCKNFYFVETIKIAVYDSNISAQGVDFSKPLSETHANEESMEFEIPCYACGKMGKNRMCVCSIPHFKEIIVMCFSCDHCGYKSAEVKGGGGISEKAKRITLSVKNPDDLNRDLYKVGFSSIQQLIG